jgi:hypothetical protein
MRIRPNHPTIAGLMAFVLFAGLILAALRHEDQYRGTRTHNFALLALWAATVCAVFRKESVRDELGQSIRMVLCGSFGAALSRLVTGMDRRRRTEGGENDRRVT